MLEAELERFDGLSLKLFGEFGIDEIIMPKESLRSDWKESRETKGLSPLRDEEMAKTMLNLRIGDGE